MNDRFKLRLWSVQEQKYRYYNLVEKESLYDFGFFAESETPDYNEQILLNDNNCWL